jgi:hypothetical protein
MITQHRLAAATLLLVGSALCAAPVFADHDRRGGKRYGGKVGFGLIGASGPGWIGFDGLALSIGGQSGLDTETPQPRGFRVRAGMDLTPPLPLVPSLGFELHAGFGRDRDVGAFDIYDTWVVAGFVRGSVPVSRFVRINGLVGLGSVGVEQQTANAQFNDQTAGMSFGVSADLKLSPYTSLSAGWTRYSSDGDAFAAVSGWSLGLRVGYY